MNATARALWFERPGEAALREQPLAPLGPRDVLVKTTASGVSTGTERTVLLGQVPDDARAAMALPTMMGSFALPISYGYAAVGAIEAAGPESGREVGAPVFCLHPHHDRFVIDGGAIRPLSSAIPALRATLAANVETAVNVVWDAKIALGDRVVVAGLGVVGLLVARLASQAGAKSVSGLDRDERRCELARSMGIDAAPRIDATACSEADVMVEASGSPDALGEMLAHAGLESRIVVASWYAKSAAPFALGGRFHPHRVTIRSSQVAVVAPNRGARWSAERRWSLVVNLLQDSTLDAMIAPPVPFDEAPALYRAIARGDLPCPPHLVLTMEPGL